MVRTRDCSTERMIRSRNFECLMVGHTLRRFLLQRHNFTSHLLQCESVCKSGRTFTGCSLGWLFQNCLKPKNIKYRQYRRNLIERMRGSPHVWNLLVLWKEHDQRPKDQSWLDIIYHQLLNFKKSLILVSRIYNLINTSRNLLMMMSPMSIFSSRSSSGFIFSRQKLTAVIRYWAYFCIYIL